MHILHHKNQLSERMDGEEKDAHLTPHSKKETERNKKEIHFERKINCMRERMEKKKMHILHHIQNYFVHL